jgi:DNA-binding NtrC family response regulator
MNTKKKILVVEDFASIRNFVCETLHRKGYDTVGAANTKEAFTILSETSEPIHLVLTDYNMPDGTGYDLLRKIKQHSASLNIPVIFLTTESSLEKMRTAKEAGLAAWIKKPYRAENFFEQIERAIKG